MTTLPRREPDSAEHGSILAGADGDHIGPESQPRDQTIGGGTAYGAHGNDAGVRLIGSSSQDG
jgi:hypothetical protein